MRKDVFKNIDLNYLAQKVAGRLETPVALTTSMKLAMLFKEAASFGAIESAIAELKAFYGKNPEKFQQKVQEYVSKPDVYEGLFEHVMGSQEYRAGVRSLAKRPFQPGEFENFYNEAISSLFDFGNSKSSLINYLTRRIDQDKNLNDLLFSALNSNFKKATHANKDLQEAEGFENEVSGPTSKEIELDEKGNVIEEPQSEYNDYDSIMGRYFNFMSAIKKKQREGTLDLTVSQALGRAAPSLREIDEINKRNIGNETPSQEDIVRLEELMKTIESELTAGSKKTQNVKYNYNKMAPEEMFTTLKSLLSQVALIKTSLETELTAPQTTKLRKARIISSIENANNFESAYPTHLQELYALGLDDPKNREEAVKMFTTLEAYVDSNGKTSKGNVIQQNVAAKEKGLARQTVLENLETLSPAYQNLIHHFHQVGNMPESKPGYGEMTQHGHIKMPLTFSRYYDTHHTQIAHANAQEVEALRKATEGSVVQGVINRSMIDFALLLQQYRNNNVSVSAAEKKELLKMLFNQELNKYLARFGSGTPIVSEYDKSGNHIRELALDDAAIETMRDRLEGVANTVVPDEGHHIDHVDIIPYMLEKASLLHMMETGEIPLVYEPGMSEAAIAERIQHIKDVLIKKHYATGNLQFARPGRGGVRSNFSWASPAEERREEVIDRALTHELQLLARKMQNAEKEQADPTFVIPKDERKAPITYEIDPSESVSSTYKRKQPVENVSVESMPVENEKFSSFQTIWNKYVRS